MGVCKATQMYAVAWERTQTSLGDECCSEHGTKLKTAGSSAELSVEFHPQAHRISRF